jgi:endo-1,3(4)-beta-glucanase
LIDIKHKISTVDAWKECRLGIQLLPLVPISEVLFSDVDYVKELVEWTLLALNREGVEEGWKGFVHALQEIYDDGNSLTNLLWWIHSRVL